MNFAMMNLRSGAVVVWVMGVVTNIDGGTGL
jgi:hypothetical protein